MRLALSRQQRLGKQCRAVGRSKVRELLAHSPNSCPEQGVAPWACGSASGLLRGRHQKGRIHPRVCVTQVALGRLIGSSDSCLDEFRIRIRMINRPNPHLLIWLSFETRLPLHTEAEL